MSEKKSTVRTTSFWMALVAIVISLIGTGVSMMEAGILRDQQQLMIEEKAAAVWPFVTPQTNVRDGETGQEIVFSLANKGVGPALIDGITSSAGRFSGSIHEAMKGIDLNDQGFGIVATLSNPAHSIVLAAGESKEVYKLLIIDKKTIPSPGEDSDVGRKLSRMQGLSSVIAQINSSYCYCSIYGDCWNSDNEPLSESEVCSGREMLRKAE